MVPILLVPWYFILLHFTRQPVTHELMRPSSIFDMLQVLEAVSELLTMRDSFSCNCMVFTLFERLCLGREQPHAGFRPSN